MIQIILSDITEAGIGRLQDTGVAEDTNIKYKKELPAHAIKKSVSPLRMYPPLRILTAAI